MEYLWFSMAVQQEPIDWRFVDVYIYIYICYIWVCLRIRWYTPKYSSQIFLMGKIDEHGDTSLEFARPSSEISYFAV